MNDATRSLLALYSGCLRPKALPLPAPGPELVECPCCLGACKVNVVEGDYVPARFVSAGGGDTVRRGITCPRCDGEGVIDSDDE